MGRSAGSRSSTEPGERRRAPPMPEAGAIALGRVVGAHGLRGGIRVRYFTDGAESFLALRRIALGRAEADPEAASFEVRSVAAGRVGELRVELVGVRTREQAEALRGRLVLVAPGELGPLAEGEYYGYQLLGCRVEGEDGSAVGILREIWATGASDLFVVAAADGGQRLVPAALLRHFDAENRRIVVEILPGLFPAE